MSRSAQPRGASWGRLAARPPRVTWSVVTTPPVPFPTSLCHRCGARRYVRSATSLFLLCTALPDKYQRQPVLRCEAWRPLAVAEGGEGTNPDREAKETSA